MIIPISSLEPQTLRNVVEAFVLREGTDYGEATFSLEQKVAQVMQQLRMETVVLVYSELHESVDIVPIEQLSNQ